MGVRLKAIALSNWSVSAKISCGFAIVLLLHVSIAVIAHYGLHKADVDRLKQDRLRSQVDMFNDIDRIVGELQRNVLLFAYAGVRGPELRVSDLQDQLSTMLVKAQQAGDTSDGATLERMREHLSTHSEIFDAVLCDRANRRQLLDVEMVQYVEEFDDQLEQLCKAMEGQEENGAAEALAETAKHFEAAQLHALQFVHSPDSVHVRDLKRDLHLAKTTLAFLLSQSAEIEQQRAKTLRVLEQYEDCCIQMVQSTRGYLHLTNVVLAGEAKELSYLAGQARRLYCDRAAELSEKMAVDSGHFSQASTLFSLITIAIGVVATWAIERNIAPGLNAITKTFDGLVQGEKISSIPGRERRDELGRLAAAAQVFRDKAALTEDLLEGVRELRELDRMHAHSQKLESLGQLAAGIAHEINTPLQCVAANVEFLEVSYEALTEVVEQCCGLLEIATGQQGHIPEEVGLITSLRETVKSRRFAHMRTQAPLAASEAADAVRRVVEIIVATQALSHPGSEDLVDCDLNELIRHSATLSRNRWKDVAKVTFDLMEDLPRVPMQPADLSQVILNLIVNASDAIAQAGQHRERAGEIHLKSFVKDGCVQVEVLDNGPGIPEKARNRIFDPFFTTKDVGKGTGQGLAISYNIIVNRLHGQIDVETSDEGTRFIISLPLGCAIKNAARQVALGTA